MLNPSTVATGGTSPGVHTCSASASMPITPFVPSIFSVTMISRLKRGILWNSRNSTSAPHRCVAVETRGLPQEVDRVGNPEIVEVAVLEAVGGSGPPKVVSGRFQPHACGHRQSPGRTPALGGRGRDPVLVSTATLALAVYRIGLGDVDLTPQGLVQVGDAECSFLHGQHGDRFGGVQGLTHHRLHPVAGRVSG